MNFYLDNLFQCANSFPLLYLIKKFIVTSVAATSSIKDYKELQQRVSIIFFYLYNFNSTDVINMRIISFQKIVLQRNLLLVPYFIN